MKQENNFEEITLGIAALMLLEAVGLEIAHAETTGALIALFATILVANVAQRVKGLPKP
jgi:hypothetical protein